MSRNKALAPYLLGTLGQIWMICIVFRKDEIWFVAKGNSQNSKLYSLVEFKSDGGKSVRKDAKFDKQYLEGKYGANPYLRKIIDWSEVNV